MKKWVARVGCILVSSMVLTAGSQAQTEQIEVSALLGEKAMLLIDGKKHLLSVGEKTVEGVQLMAIESEGVRLKVSGKITYYALGGSGIRSRYSRPEQLQERVYRDNSGMFRTIGTVNGHMVNFLVDTGATTIAISAGEARRLGIDYRVSGELTTVSTASGEARGWSIKIDRVTVGQIELNNIPAVVIDGDSPPEVLLGMSFLERLNVQHRGDVMLLETKY